MFTEILRKLTGDVILFAFTTVIILMLVMACFNNSLFEFILAIVAFLYLVYAAILTATGKTTDEEDLKKRNIQQENIFEVQVEIKDAWGKLNSMEKLLDQIKGNQNEIASDDNFALIETKNEVVKRQVPNSRHTTICTMCNYTCHDDCAYSNDQDKIGCSAMDSDKHCTQCVKKCFWKMHSNLTYTIEMTETTERVTVTDLCTRHKVTNCKTTRATELMTTLGSAYHGLRLNVFTMLQRVVKQISSFEEIAATGKPLTIVEYIDVLIATEQAEQLEGHPGRQTQLKMARKEAEWMEQLTKQGKNPFTEYRKKFKLDAQPWWEDPMGALKTALSPQ